MTSEEHAKQLGRLLANFQSLEFCLRAFIQALPGSRPVGIPPGTDFYSFPVGSELPESEITSYDSLGKLISRYNDEMQKTGGVTIDEGLVDVRDALAHGRVSAPTPTGPLRLLKFSKANKGLVRVTFNEIMNAAWFKTQNQRVHDAILVLHKNLSN